MHVAVTSAIYACSCNRCHICNVAIISAMYACSCNRCHTLLVISINFKAMTGAAAY